MRHCRYIEIFFYPLGDSKRHLRNVKACPRTQPRARFHYINYYVLAEYQHNKLRRDDTHEY